MALISNEKRIELENRLNQLVNVDRPSNIKAIQEAREQGDLSENADYDAAKTKQGEIESEIALIQDQLNNAEILNGTVTGTENLATDIIHVGSKVNGNFNGVEDTWMIVSSIEQDPFLKKCSNHSPVGKALLGHRAGETVLVQNIDHPYNIKITSVE